MHWLGCLLPWVTDQACLYLSCGRAIGKGCCMLWVVERWVIVFFLIFIVIFIQKSVQSLIVEVVFLKWMHPRNQHLHEIALPAPTSPFWLLLLGRVTASPTVFLYFGRLNFQAPELLCLLQLFWKSPVPNVVEGLTSDVRASSKGCSCFSCEMTWSWAK